jgi:hypothetical protein
MCRQAKVADARSSQAYAPEYDAALCGDRVLIPPTLDGAAHQLLGAGARRWAGLRRARQAGWKTVRSGGVAEWSDKGKDLKGPKKVAAQGPAVDLGAKAVGQGKAPSSPPPDDVITGRLCGPSRAAEGRRALLTRPPAPAKQGAGQQPGQRQRRPGGPRKLPANLNSNTHAHFALFAHSACLAGWH